MASPLQEAAKLNGQVLVKAVAGSGKGLAGTVKINQSGDQSLPDVVVEQQEKTEDPKPEAKPEEVKQGLSPEEIAEMISNAIAPVKETLEEKERATEAANAQIEELKQQLAEAQSQVTLSAEAAEQKEAEIKEFKAKLEEAQKAKNAMDDLGKLVGGFPNVNTQTAVDSSPKGLAIEYLETLNNAPSFSTHTEYGTVQQRNQAAVTNVIRRAKAGGEYRELVNSLQEYCRKEFGLFTNAVTGASTGAAGRMPDGFLDILSPLVRETHNQQNVWWQFPMTVYDETAIPSKNALIPRWSNLDAPTSLADYELSDFDTFTSIAAATGVAGDSEALSQTSVPVTVKEWGRGKGASTRPIYLPEFHRATSLFTALDAVINSRLAQNYFGFEDLLIRTQFALTSNTLYNVGDRVTDDATDIAAANDGGGLTKKFLQSLYGYMHASQTPGIGGSYIGVLNSYSLTQLQHDLGEDYRPVTTQQQELITSMLKTATGVEIGQVSGYIGNYCGFELFVSNAAGIGAAGTEGAETVTLGGALGTGLGRHNYFFGPGAVGRGIGMPMEIRPSGVNPYSRGESYIWLSHEGAAPVDVAASLGNGQQNRVFRVIALDEPV